MIYGRNYHSNYYKNTFGDGNLHFGEEMSPFLVSLEVALITLSMQTIYDLCLVIRPFCDFFFFAHINENY